jgi:DNA-directed RNA polymerase beta subunit
MMSEEQCWNILGDNFKRKGFVHHQTESFDHFVNVGLPKIICGEPPITIIPDKEIKNPGYKKYIVSFSDVYVPSPTVIEEDRTLRGFLPSEARQRDLYYDSPIYVSVTTTLEFEDRNPEIEKHFRVVIGRIPIMLRSSKCYLSNMTPSERIKAGECEKDEGGYFIVKGKERVLIPQIRGVYNVPKVIEQKPGDKYKFLVEVRSMSEETGHSALVKAMLSSDDRTLIFSIPYTKDNIPIGVVFKAMGYLKDDEIRDLIGLNSENVEKYIRLILRDSFFCEEESDGFELFSETHKEEHTNSKIEAMWKETHDEERKKWRDEMTRNNALKFIGKQAIHTLKDNEKINYAKQVVENELFPHMGITSTKKEKAYFLGYIVHKLLATAVGMRKEDDRDDYINKRVESTGVLFYELFRQLFKKYTSTIVINIEKKKQISDAMSIIPRLPIITNGIRTSAGTGNWGLPKNLYVRSGVSQVLSRLSYGGTLSHLRRVSIPVGKESKNAKIRQIHPSQIMFLCPAECFDPETQILMWDGSCKRAGDIVVGDVLIDDLGNPTTVKTTCSGIKNMYDVIPDKDNFMKHRVTDNHILTLRIRRHKNIRKSSKKGYSHMVEFFNREENKFQTKHFELFEEADEFVNEFDDDDTLDIKIEDYLKLNKNTREKLVLFKTDGINWEKKDVEMDPYLLGMWLGDGLSDGAGFSLNYKTDFETLAYWEKWAEENGAVITKGERYSFSVVSKKNKEAYAAGLCVRVEEHPLKKYLKKYNLVKNKHIPNEYLTNDKDIRLKVLAGLIDTDGSVRAEGREIRITQGPANYRIIEDAHTLAMSLGFACGVKEGKSQWTDEKTGEKKFSTYKELTITGHKIYEIPTLLPRKKLVPIENETQLLRSKAFMGSKFKLVEAGIGPYVGWQLHRENGRFIFKGGIIGHNTPEGHSIGIVLNLSLLTRISERFPSVLVKEVVEKCDNLILMEDYDGPNENTKIFLNGLLCGITENPHDLVEEIKEFRNIKMLPYDVSVSYDDIDDEVNIYSDEGRLLRPVFVVENDKLKITPEDGTNWDELIEKGLIKYVDNNELNNSVIAFNQNELGKYRCDYCEIAAAMMLGVMASIIPFPHSSQCIFKDEPVYMANGTTKKICDVEVGDEVITFNPETQQQSITKVSHTYTNKTDKQLFDLTTISGRKITATFDHRFMTYEGWRRIEEIEVEKTLVGVSTEPKPVSNIVDEYDILTRKQFIKTCLDNGIKESFVQKYASDLSHYFPIKSTNNNLYIISRLFGFISTDCLIGISPEGVVRVDGDFDHEHSAILFNEDVQRLGFDGKVARYSEKEGYGCTYRLEYSGAFPALFIALGCIYGKKSIQKYKPLPEWIKNGSDLVKREFLAGFQGGDGSKIKSGSDKEINIHMEPTSKSIKVEFVESLMEFMNDIVNLFRHLKIEVNNPVCEINKKYEDIMVVSYYISCKRINIIRYFEIVGYRYDVHKNVESGIYVEYIKYLEKKYNERVKLIEEINSYSDLEPSKIAEKMNIDVKIIYNVKNNSDSLNFGLPRGIIIPGEWRNMIKWKSTTLFIPLESKIESLETIISDITTESTNQSFLCGDTFCVHNSPRNCYQCLDPNTLVVMADNTKKAIKDIEVGDSVISVDPISCKQSITKVINQYVRETDKEIITLETESGRKITCTSDHPVLTSEGWKEAKDAEDICVIPQQTIYTQEGDEDLDIVLPETLVKEKHMNELKELGLYPVRKSALPVLARIVGYLLNDGITTITNGMPRVNFIVDGTNFELIKDLYSLGFSIDVINEVSISKYEYAREIIFDNALSSLLIALMDGYTGRILLQGNPKLMKWIKNGSMLVKREFLAGFNAFKLDPNSSTYMSICLIEHINSLFYFVIEITNLLKDFEIKCSEIEVEQPEQYKIYVVSLLFDQTIDNYINYFERIGWRYNKSNFRTSLNLYEYVKSFMKNQNIKYGEWKREIREKAIFVNIVSKTVVEGNLIADITTESENHSFIAGDSFCVHNSSMGKQAMSMFALSHLIRADTITHVLSYPQRPLVNTKPAAMLGFDDMPVGMNAIVAVACYGGLNG